MKTKLFIISLSLIWLIGTSCQKNEFDMKNPDVDQFVSILKSGNYFEKVGFDLPDFSDKHIERIGTNWTNWRFQLPWHRYKTIEYV